MQDNEPRKSGAEKARELAAKLTERLATNIIRPPRQPLVEHTLVIVSTWRAQDESVVMGAVEKGRQRAGKGSDGLLSKLFFGMLRFVGFGHIEPNGEGGVEVERQEGAEDVYIIKTMIGVRVESTEALALAAASLCERAKKLPNGLLCAITGLKPGRASLVDFQVDIA